MGRKYAFAKVKAAIQRHSQLMAGVWLHSRLNLPITPPSPLAEDVTVDYPAVTGGSSAFAVSHNPLQPDTH